MKIKRFICALLVLFAVCPGVFAEYGGVLDGFRGGSTMMDIRNYWEEYGYPGYVSYMERSGAGTGADGEYRVVEATGQVFLNGELAGEYGDDFTAERWTIGVVPGGEDALMSYLEENLSNTCVVELVPCEYSHDELEETYKAVLKDCCRDLAFDRAELERGKVVLRVSPLAVGRYSRTAAAKYGNAVEVREATGAGDSFPGRDENGNYREYGSGSYALELWLSFSAVSLALLLAVFLVVWAVGAVRKKKGKKTQNPA
ncbi:MAG: hypothetical protein PUA83_06335 [Clostridiales bacterium]|nr:hypothetical protein [Clostridiales bacterium]